MVLKIEERVILASQSPSRKMLLEQAGVQLEVVVSGVDEDVPGDFTPEQTVEALAQRKAQAVAALRPGRAVIGADSVVSIDAAKATLRRLSGRTHRLCTGVCLMVGEKEQVFHQVTEVAFYPLSEEEIAEYVAMGESTGRAGGYGIEGIGVMLVKEIKGDYPNIVGLPVAETLRRLREML